MYFVLSYDFVDDFANRRAPFRQEHIEFMRHSHQRGELLMAGPLSDMTGAVLVFKAADKTVPEQFAQEDPYVKERIVTKWSVRAWNVTIGGE